jgi:hypothetical protein
VKLILTLMLPLALLAGCASRTIVTTTPCSPPVVWLQDVPEPVLEGHTNKDLANWALSLKEALRRANLDKSHLREWVAQKGSSNPRQ